jgi:hypothetical protein
MTAHAFSHARNDPPLADNSCGLLRSYCMPTAMAWGLTAATTGLCLRYESGIRIVPQPSQQYDSSKRHMHILIGFATWTRTSDCIIPALWINQQAAFLLARSSENCAHRQVSLSTGNVIKRPVSLSVDRSKEKRHLARSGQGYEHAVEALVKSNSW